MTEANNGGVPVKNAAYWRRQYRKLETQLFARSHIEGMEEAAKIVKDLPDWSVSPHSRLNIADAIRSRIAELEKGEG
jgi:hypothetical protein